MPPSDSDLQEIREMLSEIRVWFLGNGKSGVFSRIERLEAELFGDDRTKDVGLIQDVRSVMQSSTENTRLLHQVRTIAIAALIAVAGIVLMHAGSPGWVTDFFTWLLRFL